MNSSQETEEEKAAESIKMCLGKCQREQNKLMKQSWGRGEGQGGAKLRQRKQRWLFTTFGWHRAAGDGIWSCLIHGKPLKVQSPLSLEGEQRTGAEPAAGGQPSTFWSLCPRQQLLCSGGQLTLRMVNKSSEQFYSPTYSRYSSGEHFCCIIPKRNNETPTAFKYWVQWLKAMLQDISWLYDTFSLDLCYSPTLKRIARIANIPRISNIYYFPTSLSDLGPERHCFLKPPTLKFTIV